MNYELSNILFVFPYFIEISKNKILISQCCYRQLKVLGLLYWHSAAPQANTPGLGPITRPI